MVKSKTLKILKDAMRGGWAVGAFNTSNMEVTQGILGAVKKTKKPCIIQITSSTIEYSEDLIGDLVKSGIKNLAKDVNVGFHLDHGHNIHDIVKAIELGVDSVMIDASRKPFEENVSITRRVVEYAHSKGVAVQAEIGGVPYLGREQMDIDWDEIMTDPSEAEKLVKETGVDALAVAIGNAHGFFKERFVPDWKRLSKINQKLPNTPLIIHGASDWDNSKVEKAISLGINAFNIDTDIRLAFCSALCETTGDKHCDISDPRKVLKTARESVQRVVEEKIKMFCRSNR